MEVAKRGKPLEAKKLQRVILRLRKEDKRLIRGPTLGTNAESRTLVRINRDYVDFVRACEDRDRAVPVAIDDRHLATRSTHVPMLVQCLSLS